MPFKIIKDLAEKYPLPGCHLRVIHTEHMTSAYWEIDAGSDIPDHNHPNEQIMNLIEGEFELQEILGVIMKRGGERRAVRAAHPVQRLDQLGDVGRSPEFLSCAAR